MKVMSKKWREIHRPTPTIKFTQTHTHILIQKQPNARFSCFFFYISITAISNASPRSGPYFNFSVQFFSFEVSLIKSRFKFDDACKKACTHIYTQTHTHSLYLTRPHTHTPYTYTIHKPCFKLVGARRFI